MLKEVFAATLLVVSFAAGEIAFGDAPPAIQAASRSVVSCQQGRYLGSSTYIGDDLFVGCRHVAEDSSKTVTNGGYVCDIVAVNENFDCVVMKSRTPVKGIHAARVADHDVKHGDLVWGVGYGESYSDEDGLETIERRVYAGVVSYFVRPDSVSDTLWYAMVGRKGSVKGDSGGGMFNINGELIASLWGAGVRGRTTYASNNSVLQDLLRGIK